jgi:alpha-galactosidase
MRVKPPTRAILAVFTMIFIIGLSAACAKTSAPASSPTQTASLIATPAPARKTGLALTPPMGWNSFNHFGCAINDKLVRETADAMVSSGMQAAGYEYIILDDCWMAPGRDANGNLYGDPAKFPNGMKTVADYIHSKGLKFGLYLDRGTKTCAGYPGSYGYEVQDANMLASWGVDYIKDDNCSVVGKLMDDYTNMHNALEATGRPIVFSMCSWGFPGILVPQMGIAQLWRTSSDIKDTWDRMINIGEANNIYAAYAGPGHWNDPDMLEVGNGGMTNVEYRTHFSLWAMEAAPLIAGNDLRSMDQATIDILTAPEIISVDQDALGIQGTQVSGSGPNNLLEVWSKPLSAKNTYAIMLLNRLEVDTNISVYWSDLGLSKGPATVRDLWSRTDIGVLYNGYSPIVPAHGVVLIRVTSISDSHSPAPLPPQ